MSLLEQFHRGAASTVIVKVCKNALKSSQMFALRRSWHKMFLSRSPGFFHYCDANLLLEQELNSKFHSTLSVRETTANMCWKQ